MDDRTEALLDAARRGELVPDTGLDAGAVRVLGALRARAGLTTEVPTPSECVALAREYPSAAIALALLGARDALVRMDAAAVEELADLARRIAPRTARDRVRAELTELWSRVARGTDVSEDAARVAVHAREFGASEAVIEATVCRVLGALAGADVPAALDHARRASRMAQSEQIPEAQYLAGWALARARRVSGRPHLAARILGALAAVAPERWSGAIAIESMLASAQPLDVIGAGVSFELARALSDAQRMRLEPAVVVARAGPAGALAADVRAWACLASPHLDSAEPDVAAWIAGEIAEVPRGLHGSVPDDAPAIGRVVILPGRPARRVLGIAPISGARVVPRYGRRGAGRVDALLAACALQREPIAYSDLFRSVYGFPYRPELHRGVLDVALHRARAHVGDAAILVADDGCARFEAGEALVLVDARCDRPEVERMLRVLGRSGRSTSRAIAAELGVPLRTVQSMLADLEREGACCAVTEGRAKEYILDDTTFAPPTSAT